MMALDTFSGSRYERKDEIPRAGITMTLTQRERLHAVLTAWRLEAEKHERAAEEIDGEADPWEKLMHEREAELLHRCRGDILAVIGPGRPR